MLVGVAGWQNGIWLDLIGGCVLKLKPASESPAGLVKHKLPGDGRLQARADSADPSARKPGLSGRPSAPFPFSALPVTADVSSTLLIFHFWGAGARRNL